MRFDILTLFPAIFDGYLSQSLLKKAIDASLVQVELHAPRALRTEVLLRRLGVDLVKIAQPRKRITVRHRLAGELFESGGFAHLQWLRFGVLPR